MTSTQTPNYALKRAVIAAGNQATVAQICGVQQPAVAKWLQSRKGLPAEYVLRVEAATGISRHDLRPDIYPRESEPVWCGTDSGAGRATYARAAGAR